MVDIKTILNISTICDKVDRNAVIVNYLAI